MQSTYSPLLLSESIVKKIETDCRTENNSDEGSAVESSTETANADDLPSDTCQPQPAQDESYDDNFEEEEDEDLRTSDDSEEDETDDEQDYEEEDDEDLIQFSDSEVPSVPAPQPVTYLLQPPGIKHISSFSSEESGFCENTNYPDWSNSEDEEELDDDAVDSCSFDEGLWHMLENQACFMKIPKCSTLKSTKGILNRAEECTTKLFDHEDTDNVSILCPDLFNSVTECLDKTEMRSDSCSTLNDDAVCLGTTKEKGKRRVCFKPDNELEEVHCIVAWEFAYRSARKGNWEKYSVDRARFKRRIENTATVIETCLKQKLATGNIYR